jgi:uncharacterized membrane protein
MMRDDIGGGPRFMRGLFYGLMLSAIFWLALLLAFFLPVVFR